MWEAELTDWLTELREASDSGEMLRGAKSKFVGFIYCGKIPRYNFKPLKMHYSVIFAMFTVRFGPHHYLLPTHLHSLGALGHLPGHHSPLLSYHRIM